ncbi:MAG: hypothetical protein DRJ68_02565 [Thermoprotei archaeon]|nr:MAG: hypothetical protein DRJ68_02565 [Thermoprotei archaeon]
MVDTVNLDSQEVSPTNKLIVALTGYADGGGVVTYSVSYLSKWLCMKTMRTLSAEGFVDYALNRPKTVIAEGVVKKISPLLYSFKTSNKGDTLLLTGPEPNVKWRTFIKMTLKFAKKLSCKLLCTLGGFIDNVSEPKVSYVVADESLKDLVQDLNPITYEGPSSIYTLLLRRAKRYGINAVSLWVHIPYVVHTLLPQLGGVDYWSGYLLLRALGSLMKLDLDLGEADELHKKFKKKLEVYRYALSQGSLSDLLSGPSKYIF